MPLDKAKRTILEIGALASENGRVCPKPPQWIRLFELLPNKRRDGYGCIPPEPFVHGAWSETSDEQKRIRFREHLEWAEREGALDAVYEYLASLSDAEWHHVGE